MSDTILYNIPTIRSFLTEAFDDPQLEAFCQSYFMNVFDQFGRGMRKDEKVTILIAHCYRTNCINLLLEYLQKINDPLFKKYAPYLTSDEIVSGVVVSTNPIDLLTELEEWKLIHTESQELVGTIDIPLDYLRDYRLKPDMHTLDKAGEKWQESCVPKLKFLPNSWNLRHVYTPLLEDLRSQTSELNDITKILMQTDIQRPDFKQVCIQIAGLRGILWNLLIVADKRILILIKTLQNCNWRIIP